MSEVRIKRGAQAPESTSLSGVGLPLFATAGLPHVDEELIRHLEQTFKMSVSEHYSLRDYDRMVGHQQVIAHLRALLEMHKQQ